MGQANSQPLTAVPQRSRRAHTLPHEPIRHAPKVLPVLTESPRLRSTDNGAILLSGGTISGRRPGSTLQETRPPHGHVHSNGFRSRSAGGAGEICELRSRERDPLHRSYTNLDLRGSDGMNKRFGSEPDLRIEEDVRKPRCTNNKHFRKKYRAPPPPTHDHRYEHSSLESSEGNSKAEPQRKLRLFKTRNETKKLNGHAHSKIPTYKSTYTDYKNLDDDDQSFERRYRSPCKDKEQSHSRYPDTNDMVQSTASLKREERLLQVKPDYKNSRTDRVSGCRAKTSKTNEASEAWKTPLLNRNFRHSERFKKDDNEPPCLRREKTFDNTLLTNEKENESPTATHESRMRAIGEQLKDSRLSPLASSSKPLRKSLPSLLAKNSEDKDEFQAELKKATSRIRSEIGNKISDSKPSQNDKPMYKPNPTKSANPKVNVSSPKPINSLQVINTRRPLTRLNDTKLPSNNKGSSNIKSTDNKKNKINNKERLMPDRGQASGKESTPEHSPTRKIERTTKKIEPPQIAAPQEKQKPIPSKQFYFGMIENNKLESQDHLKDFPGLGSPIIEEINNFHLIEKKLLGYHEEDEFDKFNAKIKEDCKIKNVSSESALSALSSTASDSSDENITLCLRPTLPKKTPSVPRFSPTAAWKQLATLDAYLINETTPLAVETKMSSDMSAESPRSDQSGDKSGDSGISADHNISDHRIESPNRIHPTPPTWTPQQDLGDSSSDSAGGISPRGAPVATYSPGVQPFSLSLPRDERGKQLQHGFNSLQKLKKSVSGAFGAALGSRRFDIEHEPILKEPEQNWFLTKSAPNSLSNPLLFQPPLRAKTALEEDIKEESAPPSEKEEIPPWQGNNSYLSWGGHVMYLPPAPDQPLSMMGTVERPVRSKSSGCLEAAARAARAALASEMRERERSASPMARALPARVQPVVGRTTNKGKRFTFQSTVRQLERRRLAEKLSREADLKEQQRRTELEAMRRVEEEFQRKRAREKANIRQQLRLVSSGANSMPNPQQHSKSRDDPDGSCRESPAPERTRDIRPRHSNASSELSGRSKSTTPIRTTELESASRGRQYRDWPHAHAHPPVSARMPPATAIYTPNETEAFSGSPRSDNYRLEFARGRSPRTPRPPRLLAAPRSPSTSGSELSLRQPIKIRETTQIKESTEETEEPVIVPTLRPSGPSRASIAIR